MDPKKKILQWAKSHSPFSSSDLSAYLAISRQNTAAHLVKLVARGKLIKTGSTRNARYALRKSGAVPSVKKASSLVLIKKNVGLEEDRVLQEIDRRLGLQTGISANSFSVVSYAFTEMLNNAIDHSRSIRVKILFGVCRDSIYFSIRDYGIGIFAHVKKGFQLSTEFDAMEHVFKGKQTTDPKHHSGEGIFFTSRIADLYSIRSHRLSATIDNQVHDTFVKEERFLQGTLVTFRVKRQTKKTLAALFQSFTNADFQFDKNQVSVKLSREGGLLSRSQAKRLLAGLEKYRRIDFDFNGVKELGQGFADEVFRVFRRSHPEITINFVNARPIVELMIRRALANRIE